MVDTTTLLVVTSTVAQTIVLTVTLVVFILQFRSQEKSIKESSYQGLMGRYNDLIATIIDKPELGSSLFSELIREQDSTRNLAKEDVMVYSYLLAVYGILEEAYLLYKRKWISEEDWNQWSAFLERVSRHPMFPRIHGMSSGTFDKRFEDYVSSKISAMERKEEP